MMKYQINYKSFYEDSPDMLLSVDADTGKIISCNQTLLNNLGFARDEVVGRDIVSMYHPDDLDRAAENFNSFKNTGKLVHSEFRVLKKNSDVIEVTIKLSPVQDESGKIIYSNAAWRDITELKEMQRIIEREKQKSEDLLLNILPASIADRLKQCPETIADGIPQATILFSDIVGFTSLSQSIEPEKLVHILNAIFSEFDSLVDHYGLEKIKTIGDAYMVAAGIPTPKADHAEVMAGFSIDMREVVNEINHAMDQELNIRIGINSGPVVAGVIGKKKFSYDMWGDSVNIASRMESHGLPGEIHVSQATYDLIKDNYSCEDRGKIEVKGKGRMQTYFLKSRL